MNTQSSLSCKNGRFLKHLWFLEIATPPPETAASYLPQPRYGIYIGISLAFVLAGAILCFFINSIRACLLGCNRSRENCRSTHSNADAFNFLPVRVLHGTTVSFKNDDCVVCLSEFSEGDTIRELPRCGHAFHKDCLDKWLHLNYAPALCPICRTRVIEGDEGQSSGLQQRDGREELGDTLHILSNSHYPAFI